MLGNIATGSLFYSEERVTAGRRLSTASSPRDGKALSRILQKGSSAFPVTPPSAGSFKSVDSNSVVNSFPGGRLRRAGRRSV